MSLGVSPASAGFIQCGGTVKPNAEALAEDALTYSFKCSDNIQGYSITSNRSLGYFGTDILVTDPAGTVSNTEAFTCEGPIPGNGAGCFGKMTAGNTLTADVATSGELCEANTQPKFWISVVYTEVKPTNNSTYLAVSEPFTLPIKCDTLNAKKKAAEKVTKLCAKVKLAKNPQSRAAARKRCQDAVKANKAIQKA